MKINRTLLLDEWNNFDFIIFGHAPYYQENGIKQDIEKEEFAQKYKANFVKGFYEGCNQVSIKVAINMLKQKLDDKFISSVTGLSLEEILKLKSTN